MKPIDGVTVVMDDREKDSNRLNAIRRYFTAYGAKVVMGTLHTCDYHLKGTYDGKTIDIGLEYKTSRDFAGSHNILNDRLARALLDYEHVGLILQHNYKGIQDIDGDPVYTFGHDGDKLIASNYHLLQNSIRSYERDGIYTAQIVHLAEIPWVMISILNYATRDRHKGVMFADKDDARNFLIRIPGISVRAADKLINRYGSMYNLFTAPTEDIQDTIGKKTGEKLVHFIHASLGDRLL